VPGKNAAVVDRLDRAGAVLVAKLTLGALAYGDVWYGGRTKNPWNTTEGSSGSSAGSAAATAAGLVGFTLGTETLGSIVSPCMRCGTTGLRPTFGRVPRTGAMALCWTMDKIGPICRSAEDTMLVLDAISGHDAGDPSSLAVPLEFDARASVVGLRVGHVPAWFEGDGANDLDRDVLRAVRELGVDLVEIELPEMPYEALLTILYAEAASVFEDLTLTGRDDELRWQVPVAWPNAFRASRFISAIDLVQADRIRRRIMRMMDERFAEVDVMIGPSYAGAMLLITNCTGQPSLTLPVGFCELAPRAHHGGLLPGEPEQDPAPRTVPHGITAWGRLFDEGTLCRFGMALEAARGVASHRPPGFA
jgi:Asp-tRNA(Asn)/Glu-tRNA(Gln) amidotransferase A subunit family amidase